MTTPSELATAAPIESPCVQVCVIEPTTGYCWGCGRTTNEIGGWSVFAPERRRDVMDELPARMETLPARKRKLTRRRERNERA